MPSCGKRAIRSPPVWLLYRNNEYCKQDQSANPRSQNCRPIPKVIRSAKSLSDKEGECVMRSFLSGTQSRVLFLMLVVCFFGKSGFVLAEDSKTATGKEKEPTTIAVKPAYHIVRFNKPPVIDGVLEDMWKEGEIQT